MRTKLYTLIAFILLSVITQAQTNNGPAMADSFRSDGKIYVVIAVLSIIFACIIAYLVYIDIKLKKLENK